MIKVALIVTIGFALVSNAFAAECSSIANEDKIDCVQNEPRWTVAECLAKGCCHIQVAGYPECFYSYPHLHELRCESVAAANRRDCGDASTTEVSCLDKHCCWELHPGAPYCFYPNSSIPEGEVATTPSSGGTTSSTATCSSIANADKIDCAANEPNWTIPGCLAKGCCHIEVAGYPACFYNHGHVHEVTCESIATANRKDCGDATTTEVGCLAKGCCWDMKPGAPYCFYHTGNQTTVTTLSPVTIGTTASSTTCSSIANADKIDCAANEPNWTIPGCLAKGCCHIEVAGYPACFQSHAHVHDTTCESIALASRKDCGDATTTEVGCVDKGCCWDMKPGAPYCFYHTNTTGVTTEPSSGTTASADECSSIANADKIDCAANEPNWTIPGCLAKGCCHIEVTGYPACFMNHGHVHDTTCESMAIANRKDCGDATTTEVSCVAKGCCWEVKAGAPYCFYHSNQTTTVTTSSPVTTTGDVKIYIHMMPWFETKATNNGKWGQHWTMANINPDQMDGDRRHIASKFYPLIDLYASGDTKVIDWQLSLMKLSGVTGVLIDWPGTSHVYDYPANFANSEAIIKGCDRHGLEFAIVYEDHNLGMAHDAGLISDIIAQGKADMTYIRDHYFTKSNYIKLNGAPMLMDFGPQTLKSGSQWDQLFSVFTTKPTFLTLWNQMSEAGSAAKGEFAWIYSNYLEGLNNFYKYRDISLKFGVTYPGFDSAYTLGGWDGPTWTIPVGINTFTATLNAAIAGGAHYIQVATWNDYGEGTMIEPTREFGYQFLVAIQKALKVNHTQTDLEAVTKAFHS